MAILFLKNVFGFASAGLAVIDLEPYKDTRMPYTLFMSI